MVQIVQSLKIHNTLSGKKEEFEPLDKNHVKIYACGPTVYNFAHIGNARMAVVFDNFVRLLRHLYPKVTYVSNITDIDDKIILKAKEQNISTTLLTEKFINEMNQDAKSLGVISPDIEPKATESIDDMIHMIEVLIEKGMAYVGENNDVFYSVGKFDNYGNLSGKSLDDLKAGKRIDIDAFKKNSFDFVLWKSAKPNEPSWSSPWCEG